MLIISDDFSTIKNAISNLFPISELQLCFVHFQRNVRKNMAKNDAALFIEKLNLLKNNYSDFSSTISNFEKLCSTYIDKYPAFIKRILLRKKIISCFLIPLNLLVNIFILLILLKILIVNSKFCFLSFF